MGDKVLYHLDAEVTVYGEVVGISSDGNPHCVRFKYNNGNELDAPADMLRVSDLSFTAEWDKKYDMDWKFSFRWFIRGVILFMLVRLPHHCLSTVLKCFSSDYFNEIMLSVTRPSWLDNIPGIRRRSSDSRIFSCYHIRALLCELFFI